MMTANKIEKFFDEGENIKSKMNLIIKVLNSSFESIRKKETLAWE